MPVHLIITMIKCIRTSRLSIKNSRSELTWRGRPVLCTSASATHEGFSGGQGLYIYIYIYIYVCIYAGGLHEQDDPFWAHAESGAGFVFPRILVYLVMHDSGKVSLEHLLLSRYPSQSVEPTTPESITCMLGVRRGAPRCGLIVLLYCKVTHPYITCFSVERARLEQLECPCEYWAWNQSR